MNKTISKTQQRIISILVKELFPAIKTDEVWEKFNQYFNVVKSKYLPRSRFSEAVSWIKDTAREQHQSIEEQIKEYPFRQLRKQAYEWMQRVYDGESEPGSVSDSVTEEVTIGLASRVLSDKVFCIGWDYEGNLQL